MRFSYFGLSVAGTVAYSVWAITQGSIYMSSRGSNKDAAQKVLDDANARYATANSWYLSKKQALTTAQNKISDANCYINQIDDFKIRFNNFCESAKMDLNPTATLDKDYGLQITHKNPEVTHETRSDSEIEYYETQEEKCVTDKEGKKTCKWETVRHSRRNYYTVYIMTTKNYGTIVMGTGAKQNMGCNQFDHGVFVAAKTWLKHTTGRIMVSKTQEYETQTFSSTAMAALKIDGESREINNEVDSKNNNFEHIAKQILNIIAQQCQLLNHSFKRPEHYEIIVNNTLAMIPDLRKEMERAKDLKDQADAYRKGKQELYDAINGYYNKELSIWLPIILVPIPIFIALLTCLKEKLQTKHIDTNSCCDSNIEDAVPVANFAPITPNFDIYRTVNSAEQITDQTTWNSTPLTAVAVESSAPSAEELQDVEMQNEATRENSSSSKRLALS